MKREPAFCLVVSRVGGQIAAIDLFEHVAIEIAEQFRICWYGYSARFRILNPSRPGFTVSPIVLDNRRLISFAWYEEKYVLRDAFEVHETASDLDLSTECLAWLASRI